MNQSILLRYIPLATLLLLSSFGLRASELVELLGELGGEALIHEIDKKIKIRKMEVVERYGNRVVIDVRYKRVYRPDGVEMEAYVLSGGNELDGFESTIAEIEETRGEVRLTISWDGTEPGIVKVSDQIKIVMSREGSNIKTKAFDFGKEWTASADVDRPRDGAEDTEVAEETTAPDVGEEAGLEEPEGEPAEGTDVAVVSPEIIRPVNTCHDAIQDKVAWNYTGSKHWDKVNIDRLCKGATHTNQPGICFGKVMHGGLNHGGGTRWYWKNAVDLCEGTHSASRTIQCFKNSMSRGSTWKSAIAACDGRRATVLAHLPVLKPVSIDCHSSIQGKIAWDYKGSKTWDKADIDRLCKGATSSTQPGVCFHKVMHGGLNYGGSTTWYWKNAVDLCEGTLNAGITIRCFENYIARGVNWQTAIASCRK